MRTAAPLSLIFVACLALGCSTMGNPGSRHPGITDENRDAVTRVYPATATQMSKIMADVMANDPIIDNVSMTPAGGREYRNFSKADREALGITGMTLANDVNWNVQAKSKNGHPIAVAIRLKGEASCEISVLYGARGDEELSKDLLDKAQTALERATKDALVTRAVGTKNAASKGL